MGDTNLERQNDEIEALEAIYTDEFTTIDKANHVYALQLHKFQGKDTLEIALQITLPPSYPKDSPPMYEVQAPWLKGTARQELYNALESIYLENIGEDILFMWTEKVREFLDNESIAIEQNDSKVEESVSIMKTEEELLIKCPTILHGEPLTDRKSTFQAHLATVLNMKEVKTVRQSLLCHKKISNATHNIVAYRISNEKGIMIQDCDDDGEHAAGGRLLHLLQILDVKNVIIVVSRWYGGIHLGPDRFKHINNVARNLLQREGFVTSKSSK